MRAAVARARTARAAASRSSSSKGDAGKGGREGGGGEGWWWWQAHHSSDPACSKRLRGVARSSRRTQGLRPLSCGGRASARPEVRPPEGMFMQVSCGLTSTHWAQVNCARGAGHLSGGGALQYEYEHWRRPPSSLLGAETPNPFAAYGRPQPRASESCQELARAGC